MFSSSPLWYKHQNIFPKAFISQQCHIPNMEKWKRSLLLGRDGGEWCTWNADKLALRTCDKNQRRYGGRRVLKRWTWGEAKNFGPLKMNTGMDKSSKPLLGVLRSDWLLNMHWLDCSLSTETLLFSLSWYSCSSFGSWFKFLRCGCGMSSSRYSAYYHHKSMQVPWLQSGGTSSRWNVLEYSFSLSSSVNYSQIFLGNPR